ncbi:hypothetical protein [Bacillus mycoides]|uniref:hypothetical protein n=1 Tax=Bacillus mycoides TaxID=1405 RepID=UPI003D659272
MKRSKVFSLLLSFALVFGVVFTTLSFPTGASARVMDQDSGTYNGGNYFPQVSSDYIPFKVSEGYGHLKIYIKNRGQSTLKVSLKHVASGKTYFIKKTIEKGDPPFEWISNKDFPQGVKAGDFELSFDSGGQPAYLDWAYKAADLPW